VEVRDTPEALVDLLLGHFEGDEKLRVVPHVPGEVAEEDGLSGAGLGENDDDLAGQQAGLDDPVELSVAGLDAGDRR
jgi:hypothetical protein